MSIRTAGVALLATALLVAGCSSGEPESLVQSSVVAETTAPSQPATTPSAPTQSTAAEGPMLDTISGGQIDLGEVLGQDAVLWFWAPW